jgi:hypothetical protein
MDAVHCHDHLLDRHVLRHDETDILKHSQLLPLQGHRIFQDNFPSDNHHAHPFFGMIIDNRDNDT